jgi:predicted Fe-S protein YdhL (DUF1289 family)
MSATDLTCAGCKRPLRESEAWFSWFVRNGQTIAAVVSHHYGDCMPGRSRQADWSPDHSERWERWIFPDVQAGDDLRDHTLHRVWELSGGIYAWALDERATDEVVRDVLRQLSPVLQLAELGSARRHAGKRRRA